MMMLSDKHRTLDVLAVTTTGGDTDIVNATRNVMKALEIMGSLNKVRYDLIEMIHFRYIKIRLTS